MQGYQGLKQRETRMRTDLLGTPAEALERLVRLYDAWGKPAEAARWRKVLEKEKDVESERH